MSLLDSGIIDAAFYVLPVTGLVVYVQSKIYGGYLVSNGVNAIWRSMIYSLLGAVAGVFWFAKNIELNIPAHDSIGLMEKLMGLYNSSPDPMYQITIAIYLVTFFFTVLFTFPVKKLFQANTSTDKRSGFVNENPKGGSASDFDFKDFDFSAAHRSTKTSDGSDYNDQAAEALRRIENMASDAKKDVAYHIKKYSNSGTK